MSSIHPGLEKDLSEILIYDSLTKTQKIFKTQNKNKIIKWYTCGPTVYDSAHLGHARTFITFDIIRRIFEHYGYHVLYVMNITDIDDKIIKKVNKLNVNLSDFTREMEDDFWRDMDILNIKRPNVVTRVSKYIEKMIKYIEQLEDIGFAYSSNGSVYLDFNHYIESGFDSEPLRKLKEDDGKNQNNSNKFKKDKKNSRDIVLWKKEKKGELSFSSRWGQGRPGWHLECSVMATDILGKKIDIHSGGIDLIFPHHQNEIIQAIAHENKSDFKWINYFLHSGHLNINGQKMSKSLKNFISIHKYIENIGTPQELRLLFLMHKWDKPLNYNLDTIKDAKWTNKRTQELVDHLKFIIKKGKYHTPYLNTDIEFINSIDQLKLNVDVSLRTNFNTPKVIKMFMDSIRMCYKYLKKDYNLTFIEYYYDYLNDITTMLGLTYTHVMDTNIEHSQFVKLGVDLREDIRKFMIDNKKEINKKTLGGILDILDDFRDNKLIKTGIILQDVIGNNSKYLIKSK